MTIVHYEGQAAAVLRTFRINLLLSNFISNYATEMPVRLYFCASSGVELSFLFKCSETNKRLSYRNITQMHGAQYSAVKRHLTRLVW